MSINQESLKVALGATYDATADYLVCGYDQLHYCQSKGYAQVGKIQDPGPGDSELLIFVRPKPPPPPEPVAPPPVVAPTPKKKYTRFGV